ncbi:MAG: hypothetical protein LBE35_01545 [Clostridiales bacterium]|jgi:hypothetical protein|nr:hypothetical protein [Clostridiales bacterium]
MPAEALALRLNTEVSYISREEQFRRMVVEMLEESLAEAAKPDAKWYTHEEMWTLIRERLGY